MGAAAGLGPMANAAKLFGSRGGAGQSGFLGSLMGGGAAGGLVGGGQQPGGDMGQGLPGTGGGQIPPGIMRLLSTGFMGGSFRDHLMRMRSKMPMGRGGMGLRPIGRFGRRRSDLMSLLDQQGPTAPSDAGMLPAGPIGPTGPSARRFYGG